MNAMWKGGGIAATLVLTSGADSYDELPEEHVDLPEIPAQRSRTGVIAIEVDVRQSCRR